MAIAMTIGATKIRILQESTLAAMLDKKTVDPQPQQEKSASTLQESCST